MNDNEVPRELLDHVPPRASGGAPLLHALGVEDVEDRHADFLAMLLRPSGSVHENWIAKKLVERVGLRWEELGKLKDVEREFSEGDGRYDLRLRWSNAVMVIEYKVHSAESNSQCQTYLDQLTERDALLYLSPSGKPPASVDDPNNLPEGTPVFLAMSYSEFAALLWEGLNPEPDEKERRRVLIKEYARTLQRIAPDDIDAADLDPDTSPHEHIAVSTDQFFNYVDPLDDVRQCCSFEEPLQSICHRAVDDTRTLIRWTQVRAEDAINERFEEEIEFERGGSTWSWFREKSWEVDNHAFGVCLQWGRKEENFVSLPDMTVIVGIRIELSSIDLVQRIRDGLPQTLTFARYGSCDLSDLKKYRQWILRLPKEGTQKSRHESGVEWAESIADTLVELTEQTAASLDKIVQEHREQASTMA